MVMENIIELGFVLAGVGLFDIFDLTIFLPTAGRYPSSAERSSPSGIRS